MPPKSKRKPRRRSYYEAEWVSGGVYHVFSAAVHRNVLYADPPHYRTFVELLRDRATVFAEVFAYALIPNHFHLALRLRPEATLRTAIETRRRSDRTVFEKRYLRGELAYNQLIGDYWATLLAGYAQYANPLLDRRGTLFNQTLRRIRVRDDLVSRRLIMYIHTNEVKHGMHSVYDDSGLRTSFAYYLSDREDQWLAKAAVLQRFGGLDQLLSRHAAYVKKYGQQLSAFDEYLYFVPEKGHTAEAPYHDFLEDTEAAFVGPP